ncbi:MAG: ABC transporter ATP-binding protein [Ruminococcus sp.]|nr:ABC transporter ATP-binding protein [Ruminococcus sp.]
MNGNRQRILTVRGLCKAYGSGESRVEALRNIDLDIYDGELLTILGSSGSGKSTLLNMLGGMDGFDSGSVIVNGQELAGLRDTELTKYRREKVGFVFQSFNLILELTVRENVALTANSRDPGLVDRMIAAVGLTEKADSYPTKLSGGQQQRVSIARALAKDPEILLCDEPTGALDSETGKAVLVLLESLSRDSGKTVVIVTHNRDISRMSDRTISMKNGVIVEETANEAVVSAADIEW